MKRKRAFASMTTLTAMNDKDNDDDDDYKTSFE